MAGRTSGLCLPYIHRGISVRTFGYYTQLEMGLGTPYFQRLGTGKHARRKDIPLLERCVYSHFNHHFSGYILHNLLNYMRGQSSKKRKYYFFDYLFWLGEMAQWHYKGEPRRPDGESMLMLCSMIFIYEPIFFTTAHFLYGSSVFEWFTVAMIVGSIAIIHCISRGWIYPFSRREAVMQHYEGRRFSPFRCYFFVFSLGFLIIAEAYLLPSTLMRIDGHKAEPAENTRTEVPQRWRDYLALHITVGARQEVPSEALQYLINQDGRTFHYGQPVYVMQVRKEDMGGEFRAGLLNHATFDEIQDDRRKFVECTWVKGYTPDSIRVLLTGWYEVRNAELCPVDSLEWTEEMK